MVCKVVLSPKLARAKGANIRPLLAGVTPRFVIEHANARRDINLTYPKALLNDRTPPVVRNLTNDIAGGKVVIVWETNEFTRFVLRYGPAPGDRLCTAACRGIAAAAGRRELLLCARKQEPKRQQGDDA